MQQGRQPFLTQRLVCLCVFSLLGRLLASWAVRILHERYDKYEDVRWIHGKIWRKLLSSSFFKFSCLLSESQCWKVWFVVVSGVLETSQLELWMCLICLCIQFTTNKSTISDHRGFMRERFPFLNDYKASSHSLVLIQDCHTTYKCPASLSPEFQSRSSS